jgi:hypothetical protein
MKMLERLVIVLLAVGLVCGCASRRSQSSSASKPPTQAADVPKPAAPVAPSYMSTPDYASGGRVPAMEPGRKVNEQDCTQPIDTTAGNLRCR